MDSYKSQIFDFIKNIKQNEEFEIMFYNYKNVKMSITAINEYKTILIKTFIFCEVAMLLTVPFILFKKLLF